MSAAPPCLSDVAAFNKAVSDVLRLEILRVLAQDAYGVLELSQIFDCRQSGMSHHLKILTEAGLLSRRREGNSIFYSRAISRNNGVLANLQQQVLAAVDSLALSPDVVATVAQVKRERARLSQAFFTQYADKFKAQQDLIAEFPIYGEAIAELLQKIAIPNHQLAVEIGPGAGEFLPLLAAKFERVLALDNAASMLLKAQAYCEQQGLHNLDFVCDDSRYLRTALDAEGAACVVMNMVLHHTPSPATIFQDIAAGLQRGGVLLITELCHHNQDWAREACGDLWLGFDPNELQHWAALAGLSKGHSHYFALRNGFQVQLQQFTKN
ncbi:MAG: metalloregulator ArsR/SmtB family transcription factor [Cellvibrionaceae bacterium]|nr:metalloregulator ArsR/SmtB family transcription factor [Cellvibrionaceae bacterium]